MEVVTLWLLSTDNLTGRSPQELSALLEIIEGVAGEIAATGSWQVHPVGALDLLPRAPPTGSRSTRSRPARSAAPGW